MASSRWKLQYFAAILKPRSASPGASQNCAPCSRSVVTNFDVEAPATPARPALRRSVKISRCMLPIEAESVDGGRGGDGGAKFLRRTSRSPSDAAYTRLVCSRRSCAPVLRGHDLRPCGTSAVSCRCLALSPFITTSSLWRRRGRTSCVSTVVGGIVARLATGGVARSGVVGVAGAVVGVSKNQVLRRGGSGP